MTPARFTPPTAELKRWQRKYVSKSPAVTPAPRRVYLISSWCNRHYAALLAALRRRGHIVYDSRAQKPSFHWAQIDPDWQDWTARRVAASYRHPDAGAAFTRNRHAMDEADTAILVLPAGNSAHLEAGWLARGLPVAAYSPASAVIRPELMYHLLDDVLTSIPAVLRWLDRLFHP